MLKWIILAVVILALIALVLANIRVVPQSRHSFWSGWALSTPPGRPVCM